MKRCVRLVAALLLVVAVPTVGSALPYTEYFVYDQWGGSWQDVNKSPTNPDDDLMCWAATAANVLAWGGWGTFAYPSSENIFQNINYHWTNNAGYMSWVWKWWFNGSAPTYKSYSNIDVPGGGNYYPTLDFMAYYASSLDSNTMTVVDSLLHQGYGVGLLIRNGAAAHAVTCWGFSFDSVSTPQYHSIFVTDSDDGRTTLMNYPLIWQNNVWYLGGGYAGWYIAGLQALKYAPTAPMEAAVPTPFPPAWLLMGAGVLIIALRRHRENKEKIAAHRYGQS